MKNPIEHLLLLIFGFVFLLTAPVDAAYYWYFQHDSLQPGDQVAAVSSLNSEYLDCYSGDGAIAIYEADQDCLITQIAVMIGGPQHGQVIYEFQINYYLNPDFDEYGYPILDSSHQVPQVIPAIWTTSTPGSPPTLYVLDCEGTGSEYTVPMVANDILVIKVFHIGVLGTNENANIEICTDYYEGIEENVNLVEDWEPPPGGGPCTTELNWAEDLSIEHDFIIRAGWIVPDPTMTSIPTITPTLTPVPTSTPSPSATPTQTQMPTNTSTPLSSATPTLPPSYTPTETPSVSPTFTSTPAPTNTNTITPSPTSTVAEGSPTLTALPTSTPTPTAPFTYTPAPTYTAYPTYTPENTATPVPTATIPTPTSLPSGTPTATVTPTASATLPNTSTPTNSPSPTQEPSGTPSPTPTHEPYRLPFFDDFEDILPWHTEPIFGDCLWHSETARYKSFSHSWAYNLGDPRFHYNTGSRNSCSLISPLISLQGASQPELSYWDWIETENRIGFDVCYTEVSSDYGATWNLIEQKYAPESQWNARGPFDLSQFNDEIILIRFRFDTGDSQFNEFEGWYVDDVKIEEKPNVTPTPTPYSGDPGVDIRLNDDSYYFGMRYLLELDYLNPSLNDVDADIYVVLDVYGSYWFWPTWSRTAGYADRIMPKQKITTEVILDFIWPSYGGRFEGVLFWAAALQNGTTSLYGKYDYVSFGANI